MSAHDHTEYVDGCFRCDLSREEPLTTKSDAVTHDYSGHNWWECEVCHQRVSDILDARLRKAMLAEGYPEHDVDRMIAQARDVGRRLRVSPPGVAP